MSPETHARAPLYRPGQRLFARLEGRCSPAEAEILEAYPMPEINACSYYALTDGCSERQLISERDLHVSRADCLRHIIREAKQLAAAAECLLEDETRRSA